MWRFICNTFGSKCSSLQVLVLALHVDASTGPKRPKCLSLQDLVLALYVDTSTGFTCVCVSTWYGQYLSWADRPGCDPPTECSPVSSASLRTGASPWSARNKTRTLLKICLQHRSEKENILLSSNEFKNYIALCSSCLIWLHSALWYMTIFFSFT